MLCKRSVCFITSNIINLTFKRILVKTEIFVYMQARQNYSVYLFYSALLKREPFPISELFQFQIRLTMLRNYKLKFDFLKNGNL